MNNEEQTANCAICATPTLTSHLAEASWLPPLAIEALVQRNPGWQLSQGACPSCVQRALLEILTEQGQLATQQKSEFSQSQTPEIAFGVLPTPMRLPSDPRYRGRGVTLAFVDAGFYPHPDLTRPRNRIRAWADASVDPVEVKRFGPDDRSEWPGWDAADPLQWHGLMTSSVAAGNGFLSHNLYRGLASDADLVLVQVRDERGHIGNENITRALQWLHAQREALDLRIVSISVSGEQADWRSGNPVDEAVAALVRDGVTVVVASGNAGERHLVPPATAPAALTVGGVDDKNNFDSREVDVWHSNYGATVTGISKPELVAPSIWVVAPILPGSEVAEEAERLFSNRSEGIENRIADLKLVTPYYQHVDGTSFAAPIVASVVACMLEANPSLTPRDVREFLLHTAQPVEGADREVQGAGAVDASRALAFGMRAIGGPMVGVPLSPEVIKRGDVTFWLYDPDARQVYVRGDWDDWAEPGLRAREERPCIWSARLSLQPGAYRYRFNLDNDRWLFDPDNPRKVPNAFGGFDSLLDVE